MGNNAARGMVDFSNGNISRSTWGVAHAMPKEVSH
jgi:hypothetical protein